MVRVVPKTLPQLDAGKRLILVQGPARGALLAVEEQPRLEA